jgi:hypothetical protein
LQLLEALTAKLSDEDDRTVYARAAIFLAIGGLVPVIYHLRGNAASCSTPDPDVSPLALSAEAGRVLTLLLDHEEIMEELQNTPGMVPALMDALRAAPDNEARLAAVRALYCLAHDEGGECREMAEAGVFGCLLALFDEMGEQSWARTYGSRAGALGCMMVGKISARQLEQAIRMPGVVQPFTALLLLQVAAAPRNPDSPPAHRP